MSDEQEYDPTNIPNIYDTIDWFEKQRPAMHSLTFDMFVAARYYLMDELRRILTDCGVLCECCAHSKDGIASKRCDENDGPCSTCGYVCICRNCKDGCNWRWNGKRKEVI